MPVPANSTTPERFTAAFRVLAEALAVHAFPSCAFGVLSQGEILLQHALGQFTYESDSPSAAPNTVYDVASLTKVVATTAMAMLLHQQGQLDLETPLGALLPEFLAGRAPSDPAHRVTLRHLLAHNSGLPGYAELFRTPSTPGELLQACLRLPLQAEPDTRAEYSDPGFILLGKALEALVGESLDLWARRNLFSPLQMAATGFCPPDSARSSIPPTELDSSFRHRRIQGEVQDENAWVLGGVAGHAGLFSNVGDLLRFAAAVLNRGTGATPPGPAHLFEPETVRLFAERQEPTGSTRAIGWDTPSASSSSGRYFSANSIGHLGYSGCSLWIDLDADLAIALLTNRTWPDRQSQLIKSVRPAFHDAIRQAL